jgi:hypothetical protein
MDSNLDMVIMVIWTVGYIQGYLTILVIELEKPTPTRIFLKKVNNVY